MTEAEIIKLIKNKRRRLQRRAASLFESGQFKGGYYRTFFDIHKQIGCLTELLAEIRKQNNE